MEELYDVIDENNQPLGIVKPKSGVHLDGDWHRAAHVWVVNGKKEILVQKRSSTKGLSPNLWDLSMGGHVSAGEEPLAAAQRELKEELGMTVSPEQLKFLFLSKEQVTLHNGIENLFHYVYLVRADLPLASFQLDPKEVAEIKYLSLDEFAGAIQKNKDQWMSHWEEYDRVIKYLRNN